MPSTYTLNNGIELIGTGEQSGTWGSTTNTNLELLDTALDGQVTVTLSSTGSSGAPNALPISDGSNSDGRNRLITFNDGSDLGGTAYVQLTPNDAEKIIYVRNSLSGSRSILLFQGTYNASNDYEVPAGTTAVVFFNGAGTGAVAANVFNNAHFDALNVVGSVTVGGGVTVTGTVDAGTVEFDNLSGTGAVSVTNILDEDDMSSDSATALATQQSIKKYVDDKAAAQDTLAEVLANGNTTGGNAIQMTTTDELQFRDTGLKISSSADGQLDIDSDGTIDINATTSIAFDTDTLFVDSANDRVGINQATPYVDLQVNGDMRLGSTALATDDDAEYAISSGGQIKIHANDSGADASFVALSLRAGKASSGNTDAIIDFYVNDDEKMRLNDSGFLGLGTNNPLQELHVFNEGTLGTTADNADIRIQGNNGGSGYMDVFHGPTSMGLYGASTSPFQLAWNSIDRLNINGNETIFHDTGADYNFRIESTGYGNMFFMDSGNDMIGIRTNSPDAALDVAGSLRYYNVRPGYCANAGTSNSANWWKIGRASHLSGSRSLKIAILGTQSYGAGGNIAGETTILFRGNNASTTIDGTFWSETQGNGHIAGVAWKQTGTADEFDIWVNWTSTFAGVDIYVDTQATWEFGVLDTGSETTPSGATTISPKKFTYLGTSQTIAQVNNEVVINNGEIDIDFRVASADYTYALTVDAATNTVLIGTSDTTHDLTSYSLIIGVQSGTMKPHVLIDGTFTQQDINTHGFINIGDQNFGIGGGNFNGGAVADDLYLFAYEGAGRGIRFSTTVDGTTDRSEGNANWTTRGLINASTGYWGIGSFTHSSPPSRLLHVKGPVADGAPPLYIEASSDGFAGSSFNWATSSMASGMPTTASKRFVHVIGQAASSGQSASFGYAAGTNNNEKAAAIGLFNKNDIIMANMNGYVTKKYQPFFYAKTTNAGDGNTASPYQFQNVVHNVGSMFVTTGTGAFERFVAPIDGVYSITVQPGYKQTSVDFASRLRVNGSEFTDLVRIISTVDPDSHSGSANTVVIKLSEDDYVDVVPGFTPYHCNSSFNFFSAHLLS